MSSADRYLKNKEELSVIIDPSDKKDFLLTEGEF